MKQQQHKEDNRGQAAIIAIIVLTAVLLTVMTTILTIATSEYQLSQNDILDSQVKYLAESGVENAMLQIGENGSSFTGGAFVSPIDAQINGSDNVTVTYNTSVSPEQATIVSIAQAYQYGSSSNIAIQRSLQVVIQMGQNPPILNYALFANNYIAGEWFQVQGNVQSNNELQFFQVNFNSDNINSVGNGNGFGNYFWQVNNTNTNSIFNLSTNLFSWIYNSNLAGQISCNNSTYWGGSSCLINNSTIGSIVNLAPPPQINLPTFPLAQWISLAQSNGTYFNSTPSFESYLQGYSNVSSGIDTITPPAGVYYVNSNSLNLPTTDSAGNPIVYNFTNSSLLSKNGISTNASFIDTSPYSPSSGKYLPALVAGNQGIYIGVNGTNLEFNVTGVIYTPGNISINDDIDMPSDVTPNDGNSTININGAIWAGGSLNINNLYYSDYNAINGTQITLDPTIINATTGFNIISGTTQILSWNEIN
jgi:hypothetical protein